MPVDRIITVSVQAPGHRNMYGEYVEGAVTEHRVWATRFDRDLQDIEEEGGARTETRRDWRVRWTSTLADVADLTTVSVTDGGIDFDVQNIVEDTGRFGETRRRWLRIQGVSST